MSFFTNLGGAYHWHQAENNYKSGFRKFQQQNYSAAIGDFNKAIENKSDYEIAYIFRGFANMELENVSSAIKDFNTALQINANSIPAHSLRGLARIEELKDEVGAMEDFNKAIKISPKTAWDYYCRGIAKRYLGDNEGFLADSLKAYDMGLRLRL